jgi:hypothetical protein
MPLQRGQSQSGAPELQRSDYASLLFVDATCISDRENENASSFKDDAEGFGKSLLSKVSRLTTGEGQSPSPEFIRVLRNRRIERSEMRRKEELIRIL